MSRFRFSVGPWNVADGVDVYGPPTRTALSMEHKIRRFADMGFSAIQFHDDDAVPDIASKPLSQIEDEAHALRALLDELGLAAKFVAPRLWFGDPRRASLRDVCVAVGEVDWLCTGDAALSSLIDRLLQVGELTGVGARTAWGTGVLEIADRAPMRAAAAGNKRRPRRSPSRPSGIGGTGRTPSPRFAGEPGEWGFDDERPGGSRDRRFGSE